MKGHVLIETQAKTVFSGITLPLFSICKDGFTIPDCNKDFLWYFISLFVISNNELHFTLSSPLLSYFLLASYHEPHAFVHTI
jgi:hypothetical protein